MKKYLISGCFVAAAFLLTYCEKGIMCAFGAALGMTGTCAGLYWVVNELDK